MIAQASVREGHRRRPQPDELVERQRLSELRIDLPRRTAAIIEHERLRFRVAARPAMDPQEVAGLHLRVDEAAAQVSATAGRDH